MFDLEESFDRLLAHALGGTVGRNQLWMGGFQPFEPLQQAIVLQIGDLRRRFQVIFAVVVADLFAQPGDFSFWIGGHGTIML